MTLLILLFVGLGSSAQAQSTVNDSSSPPQPANPDASVTIPAGTHVAMVLTQPVQSRNVRRGDDIYAQITSPVLAANQVAIPPGTFVQGTVDKLDHRDGRGELHLQSMSITFPDGYVTQISGAITLETDEGYALNDPGSGRSIAFLALPMAGAGVGALIGHSVGGSSSTITTSLPPGCTGPPPECLSSSMTVPGDAARNTAIGAVVGGVAGGVASMAIFFSSHHFFIDVGTPLGLNLPRPVSLQQQEVSKAVQQQGQGPVAVQPVFPRPVLLPPPDIGPPMSPATSPGTPPTVLPGPPGPDGVPGAPIIIPGTPPGVI